MATRFEVYTPLQTAVGYLAKRLLVILDSSPDGCCRTTTRRPTWRCYENKKGMVKHVSYLCTLQFSLFYFSVACFTPILLQFHVENNHDYFMVKPTMPWFASLIWIETLFHVPFFAFAVAGFLRRWNAVRIPCIIYGTEAATSVVPIIADILSSDNNLTDGERYKLAGICELRTPCRHFTQRNCTACESVPGTQRRRFCTKMLSDS